ncbi:MAG: two-component regulator propeller domain-containing protein [Flavobacteriales bacterium]
MMRTSLRPAALAGLLALCGQTFAQTYKLRPIGSEEGLTNSFVHALAQDASGYLWIGTGEGAGRFDGKTVRMFTTADSLTENFISSIYAGANGDLWLGHNEGGITLRRGGKFRKVALGGLSRSTINALAPDGKGGVWAAAQNNGILHVDGNGKVSAALTTADVLWYSLLELESGELLAGASDGLHLLKLAADGTLQVEGDISNVVRAPVRALARTPRDGRIHAGTEGEGIISFSLKAETAMDVSTLGVSSGMDQLQVRALGIGANGQLVAGTFGNGAFEFTLQGDSIISLLHYDTSNGLGTDNVSVVLTDNENNLWFARFGLGLARLLDRALVYYAADGKDADVQALTCRGNDVWFGLRGSVMHVRNNDMREVDTLGIRNGLPADNVTALRADADGKLWVGTGNSGLWHQDEAGTFRVVATASDRMAQQVRALTQRGDETWVGTSNGAFVLSHGKIRHLTTENGLMHNQVNALLTDRDGQVWMACNNGGVSVVKDTLVRSFTLTEQGNSFHVTGIAQDSAGTLWFSTSGNGVRWLQGEQVMGLGEAQGLRSDYCYAIAADGKGSVWVAHRGGSSRIDRKSKQVRTYARHFGIAPDRAINTLVADERRNIWFGTDKGVLRYDVGRDADEQMSPPITITGLKVSGKDTLTSIALQLPPDNYRLQFDFLGINLKDPDDVVYRYMLEGHDLDWTYTDQQSAYYMRVEDGNFRFKVQATMRGTPFTGAPAELDVFVEAPVWKRTWFQVLCGIALVLAIWGFVRLRERGQRMAQARLQRALDERTFELKTKKEEIEAKNKDITDSINYAQRIQQAILPSENALSDHFPNSFIIHRPRDIVSGDFYWFKRFGNRLILACADCTGHGVPGGFMSMIGSMLLREISTEHEIRSPDGLLTALDRELRSTLHYNSDGSTSRDGMDISVCEVDFDQMNMRAASAMHDILHVRGGEWTRHRGTRRSIGGHLHEGAEAGFQQVDLQLQKGDRLYFFSDGIPDQFGGTRGKKLKVAGLQSFLKEHGEMSMEEQGKVLREFLIQWMEGHEQVDDMLVIGFEV